MANGAHSCAFAVAAAGLGRIQVHVRAGPAALGASAIRLVTTALQSFDAPIPRCLASPLSDAGGNLPAKICKPVDLFFHPNGSAAAIESQATETNSDITNFGPSDARGHRQEPPFDPGFGHPNTGER